MALMTMLNVLLAGFTGIVFYGIFKGTRSLIKPLFSPLRRLPGPKQASFIFGNMKQLERSSNREVQAGWVGQYGKVMKFKWIFGMNILLTTDVKALNHILSHSADYQKPELTRIGLSRIFGEGLLVAEGENHRKQRRIMNRSFGPASIKALTPIFLEKSLQLRDIWASELLKRQNEPQRIEVLSSLNKATLDVIGLAGFNYKFGALNANQEPNELTTAFMTLFSPENGFSALAFLQLFFPILRRIPTKRQKKADEARATMRRIGEGLVRERKNAVSNVKSIEEKEAGLPKKRDLLSVLVQANMDEEIPESQRLSDEDVLAQVPTFLVAGHETTSSETMWALFALSHSPEAQTKLRNELLSVPTSEPDMDTLAALPYLDAVVRETLRLHAAVPGTSRVAMRDDVIPLSAPFVDNTGTVRTEIVIKKGEPLTIPILLVNKDKDIWGEDAEEFKPERWFNPPEAASAVPGLFSNMLTFLGGARSCIGYRFALMEMKALLFTLVRTFEFAPAVPAEEIEAHQTVVSRPYIRGQKEAGAQMPLIIKLVGDSIKSQQD